MPNRQIIITQEPVFKDGYGEDYILLNNYQYDKTLMPEGKSIINVLLNTSLCVLELAWISYERIQGSKKSGKGSHSKGAVKALS